MRKWYAFLSGKKMLGIGLGAVVALTALLAVNFYREQNDRYVTTNGSEALTQAEQANKTQSDGMPSEANQVAEEMNHELPVGSEVGEQQLAEQSGESEELAANDASGQNANQDMVLQQTPKYMRRMKMPFVKAKVGPRIMTLIADPKVYEILPVKKEVKAVVSGIYITEIKSVRGGAIPAPPKKKGFFARFKKDKSAKNTTAEKTESKGKKNK